MNHLRQFFSRVSYTVVSVCRPTSCVPPAVSVLAVETMTTAQKWASKRRLSMSRTSESVNFDTVSFTAVILRENVLLQISEVEINGLMQEPHLIISWLTLSKVFFKSESAFTHVLQPWTYLDITRRSCMLQHKCPNHLDRNITQTLLYNVWLGTCVNREFRRIHSERVGMLMTFPCDWYKTGRKQTSKGEEEGSKMSDWRDDEIWELLSVRADIKIFRQKFKERQETRLFMTKLPTGYVTAV